MFNPQRLQPPAFLLILLFASRAFAGYDCSQHKPFKVLSTQEASISVDRTYWDEAARSERTESVCATTTNLKVRVLDIRGREEEWYYCEQGDSMFTCETKYRGAWARIRVRPAVVVRNTSRGTMRDTHFHAFVQPIGGSSSYVDIFARAQSRDLRQTEIVLDASGGGRGERSDTDSYYVLVNYLK